VLAALFVAALCVVGFLGAGRACAHDPRFACSPRTPVNPVVIADPEKSWAFYGHLATGEADRYAFSVRTPLRVPWNILVDERDARNPARPSATLFDANGAVRARIDLRDATMFFEPFSRERYLSSPERELSLAPGAYTIDVSMRGGHATQRYTLAIGEAERFSVLDVPYVAGAIVRIRALRY
jgi:hypothetical protein